MKHARSTGLCERAVSENLILLTSQVEFEEIDLADLAASAATSLQKYNCYTSEILTYY
jgi:hypothetical protein